MKKMIFLGILVLLLPIATGLGVAPAEKEFFHDQGVKEYDIKVIDRDSSPKTISLSATGDLAGYVALSQTELKFSEGEDSKTVRVKLNLTGDFPPGPNTAKIRIIEVPEEKDNIHARIAVNSNIIVNVPYPGRYLEADLVRTSFKPGKKGNFIIEANNLGQEDLEGVFTEVEVLGEDVSLRSEHKRIISGAEELFSLPWTPTLRPGSYQARAEVSYAEKSAETTKTFTIGERGLRISSINIPKFSYGGEITLILNVVNEWNEPLEGAFAEVALRRDQQVFAESPTQVQSFEAYETRSFRAVLDTERVPTGEYELVVTLNYLDRSEEKVYPALLTDSGLEIQGVASEGVNAQDAKTWMYITLIALLTFIVWMKFHWISLHKRDEEQDE